MELKLYLFSILFIFGFSAFSQDFVSFPISSKSTPQYIGANNQYYAYKVAKKTVLLIDKTNVSITKKIKLKVNNEIKASEVLITDYGLIVSDDHVEWSVSVSATMQSSVKLYLIDLNSSKVKKTYEHLYPENKPVNHFIFVNNDYETISIIDYYSNVYDFYNRSAGPKYNYKNTTFNKDLEKIEFISQGESNAIANQFFFKNSVNNFKQAENTRVFQQSNEFKKYGSETVNFLSFKSINHKYNIYYEIHPVANIRNVKENCTNLVVKDISELRQYLVQIPNNKLILDIDFKLTKKNNLLIWGKSLKIKEDGSYLYELFALQLNEFMILEYDFKFQTLAELSLGELNQNSIQNNLSQFNLEMPDFHLTVNYNETLVYFYQGMEKDCYGDLHLLSIHDDGHFSINSINMKIAYSNGINSKFLIPIKVNNQVKIIWYEHVDMFNQKVVNMSNGISKDAVVHSMGCQVVEINYNPDKNTFDEKKPFANKENVKEVLKLEKSVFTYSEKEKRDFIVVPALNNKGVVKKIYVFKL
jgi:hypothetical protein